MNTDKLLRDLSLLAARLTLGGTIAAHGAQKMFGAFGGPGIEGASQFMSSLGFEPGEKYARASSAAEIASGTLISLGALGPIGPAMLLSVMITAIETVHRPKGYWNTNGGYEMNTMIILLALLLATEGYGSFSFDAALGIHEKTGATFGWLALAGGVGTAIALLQQRQLPMQQQEQPQPSAMETGETETPATVS
jgi:putative oxidoreductase